MTIGDVASRAGLTASAIRYYERVGVLPAPRRVNGQRRYGPEVLDRLAVLRLAQACGFHLEEVRTLLQGFQTTEKPSERWRKLAERKRQELDQQMKDLAIMRRLVERVAECECFDLAECGRSVPAGALPK